MSKYIVTLDKVRHKTKKARSDAIGKKAKLKKEMRFDSTYEIECTQEELAEIEGIVDFVDADEKIGIELLELDSSHLLTLFGKSIYQRPSSYTPISHGAGQEVYLLDTGINENHVEFANATINNLHSAHDGRFDDTAGHGTAMASLIIGENQGTAKEATLHNIKLFEEASGNIAIGAIMDAFEAILEHHEPTQDKVKVVSMSWVTPQNKFLDNKVLEMNSGNLVCVAAAGNDGGDVDNFTPAGIPEIITVGATDSSFAVKTYTNSPWGGNVSESFSSFGAALDIWAPGVGIFTAQTGNITGYGSTSGTSCSAALTAGILTHYIDLYPDYNSDKIKDTIVSEGMRPGAMLLDLSDLMDFYANNNMTWGDINSSIVTTMAAGEESISKYPSGRLLNVKLGESTQLDLELNPNVTDVEVLNFSPTPPWITLDTSTGILTIDTTNIDVNLSPAAYLFAVKGTINDEVSIEEYSVGVYTNDESELDVASSYYYDADEDSYDEAMLTQYAGASKQ